MSSPRKELPFWPGFFLAAVILPAVFWLRLGRINGYSIGVVSFFLLLMLAIQFVPRMGDKLEAETGGRLPSADVKPSRFDFLMVIWLLSVPFAPLAMWSMGSLWEVNRDNWQIELGLKTLISIVIPCVCVLPMFRYARGAAAPYALLIMAVGTSFPVLTGLASATDLVRGPQWQDVDITDWHRQYVTIRMRSIPTHTLDVKLADGRTLEANSEKVTVKTGKAKALVLDGLGIMIDEKWISGEGLTAPQMPER
jgi:hypothetical protein